MGTRMSSTICCSVRDKNDIGRRGLPMHNSPQFWCSEAEVRLSEPRLSAFAPLWSSETACIRRLALASATEVHVYSIGDDSVVDVPPLSLEYKLQLTPSQGAVTAILFTEETTSRHLAVACSPLDDGEEGHVVRIFSCDQSPSRNEELPKDGRIWSSSDTQACIASLSDHRSPIKRIVISPTYMLTVDTMGVCHVWMKNRSYLRKATSTLHQGGVADLAADRLHAYSAGLEDKCVCVWSMPDLEIRHTVRIEIPQVLMPADDDENAGSSATANGAAYRLLRVTALRRPLSRWAGSQGSSRHASTPKGTLYVAGILAADGEDSPEDSLEEGSGVLMEWSLGMQPQCQCAQLTTPIVSLVYGPYDNGPLITADARGKFRVWDCVPRLTMSQELSLCGDRLSPGDLELTMVVEPQHGLYTTVGDRRLFIWRRSHPSDILEPL